MAARGVSSEGQAPPGPAPGRLSGPWERSVRGGWTGSSGGPAQLPQCQPVPPTPPASPAGVLGAPRSPERGAGQGSHGGRRARARAAASLGTSGMGLQPLPSLAWVLGPWLLTARCSRPIKANPWSGARWGPRALPSQAAPQQARVETLPGWRVPVPAARSQQWSDKKDKVGE